MRISLNRFVLAVCAGLAVIGVSFADGGRAASSSSRPESSIDAAWQTEVTRALDRQEYAVTWQPQAGPADTAAAWQAPNRAHGFRSYFSTQGVRLEPRESGGAAWSWSVTAASVGRCKNRGVVGPAEIHVDGQRVQLQRESATEWYDNSTRGLEQGFDIAVRPGDCSDTQQSPLVIELTLGGSLVPKLSTDKQAIDFSDGSGRPVLRYAGLEVVDSGGESLSSHLELFSAESARGIRIVIDDAKAAYPIAIDPLITSAAWTGQSDQVLSRFGVSVAAAGDVNGDGFDDVIVGAERFDAGQTDEGRVFVYYGSASGLPPAPSWTAEANQAVALFGSAVSSAGDVNGDGYSDIVVGARQYDVTLPDEGAAFVYLGSATGLNNGSRPSGTPANADWTKAGGQSGARFGASVANAADVNGDGKTDVLIGAPQFDDGEVDEGAVYLFAGSATGLAATPLWSAQSNQDTAEFGSSVATAGDVNADGYLDVVVGAHNYTNSQAAEGAAFVYYGASAGPATSPSWTAYGDQPVAAFGSSVAAAGDVNGDGFADLVVGAGLYDDGSTDEGALFVFYGSATGLDSNGSRATGYPSNANWRAESDMASAEFGAAVAPAGDVNGDGYGDVIAGSPNYSAGESSEGGAFVYFGSASGLNRNGTRTQGSPANADWKVESNQASAEFGTSVGAAGDINGDSFVDLIVGVPRYDDPETDEGRALVYLGGASGPATTPSWTVTGDEGSMQLGYSIASAGDVNGDGYNDVIIGAPYYNAYYNQGGRALLYLGSATGLSTTSAWTAEAPQSYENFGFSVAGAGDVNADGYDDVVVSAPQSSYNYGYEGRVALYLGSPSGLSASPAWMVRGGQYYAWFGYSVAGAGDVDGDGFADVVIGARYYDNGDSDEGRAYLYRGSPTGLELNPAWTFEPNVYNANLGASVSSAGDVNGDGFSDIIVGAPYISQNWSYEGKAFVFLGSANGLGTTPVWTALGAADSAYFGNSVASAGDVNGDGRSDVIVGAYYSYTGNGNRSGRAYVYYGTSAGVSTTPAWTGGLNEPSGSYFGYSVASAGDVNSDGFSDVVVGALSQDTTCTDSGRAFVYLGSAAGLSTNSQWDVSGTDCYEYLGRSVAGALDVNGDGFSDLLTGSQLNNNSSIGRVRLFYGNGGAGTVLRPRQLRTDDSTPIPLLGWSDAQTTFRVSLQGSSSFGAGRAKLQWEAKPAGTVFDGLGTGESAAWQSSSSTPAQFDELVDAAPGGRAYHWRARLLFDRASSPFQAHSRWISRSWNGAQEADLALPRRAELALTISDSPDPYVLNFHSAGITYTVNIANAGPEQAHVRLTDTLPPGTTFVSATPSQGACTPAAGIVNCDLGAVTTSGASVSIVVMPSADGIYANTASITTNFVDSNLSNNSATESTTVVTAAIGDRVWRDLDNDGLQDAGEPGVVSASVYLFDGATGAFLDVTFTDANGIYRFPNVRGGPLYRVRFIPPVGYLLSPRDRGGDDRFDSDADPATGDTPVFSISGAGDRTQWDAGMVSLVNCELPDERLYVYSVTLTTDGNHYPILNFMDPNQPSQITGYNVYRSSSAATPQGSWPLVASDVVDMDQGAANKQWIDTSGDVSPSGIWYYHVVAYNRLCPAEGPW